MEPLKVIVIGAGSRGQRYTDIMHRFPERYRVVGVAEPIDARREYVQAKHGIDKKNCFTTWEDILAVPRFADIAIISTMDQLHKAPAIKAMELGYDLLLEKPIANTKEECMNIYAAAKRYGRKVMVCHVLRYTPYFKALKKIITDGVLGEIVAVSHLEAVGNIHQSHSFVRGNWGNEERSSFMLLQKCCHDMDILQWLLDKNCKHIQSFGSLQYFRKENAPAGAPERCHEGCPAADTCYYNAVKLYYDDKNNDWFRNAATGKVGPTDAQVMEALKTTQYGKCVFQCDNDVVDHQTVNMEFEGGTTVTLTMAAFNQGGRKTHIMGTKGELYCDMKAKDPFIFYDFATKERRILNAETAAAGDSIVSGHGGGDDGIVDALYLYETGLLEAEDVSEIGISYQNHMLTFAAEEARVNGNVIDMAAYLADK